MKHATKAFALLTLGVACLGSTACGTVKAWTAPTWVYTNPEGRLELLNENAGHRFCLTRGESTVCGTYADEESAVFSSAMAHFNRQPEDVRKPEKPGPVEFTTEDGASWKWIVQPDGSITDSKAGVWQLIEFRQFGRTHTE